MVIWRFGKKTDREALAREMQRSRDLTKGKLLLHLREARRLAMSHQFDKEACIGEIVAAEMLAGTL